MEFIKTEQNGVAAVLIKGEGLFITDVPSALDLMSTVQYETGCSRLAIGKEHIAEDFFRLGTGLAGEILQKFINYHVKFAVFGDFSGYTSKPLHDFIYESNNGSNIFFASDEADALARLYSAK